MLVSAAVIAYLGAFTAPWRARLVQAALGLCAAQVRCMFMTCMHVCVALQTTHKHTVSDCPQGVPASPGYTLSAALGSPVAIRQWLLTGLPNDALSIDNAIIVARARRWPLMVDPQVGEGDAWGLRIGILK
jgi:dynein heavy chain